MCHKGHTISIDRHAVDAHLRHGDRLGACTTPATPEEDEPDRDAKGGNETGASEERPPLETGKVVVCHHGAKTRAINTRRVEAHLRHGDSLGACA